MQEMLFQYTLCFKILFLQVAFLLLVKRKTPFWFNLFLCHNDNFLMMCEYNFFMRFQSCSLIFISKYLNI